ncbi:uncharacterized protein [Physcomitrium patens]|uniref:Uncharacterized protein n=1 Tax=Physcomitrium patens TaxID=3218 RepID=A0A2K1JYG2_PHYPA|nr:uncharacterized protein LOC112287241 [Physcomitrium patens]PNR46560.1 hypothetical protein PHYPA_013679 [Physcomitrium patens]|eukprot:XP_024385829.1 uncharacterized protein LOC112287241 [Physcomitrella patens]
MSAQFAHCFGLQCGFQGDPIHHRAVVTTASLVSCPSASSVLGLAMCTGGHWSGLQTFRRKLKSPVKVNCSVTSGTDATAAGEGVEIKVSDSGRSSSDDTVISVIRGEKKWMMATLAAMVMVGAAAVGEPAMAFNWFGQPKVEKDPVEPFTLYGSILKKYLIEDVVDNKVVGRRKGFTASTCVNALDASKETPELQGVPAGLKVTIIGEPSCAKGQGQTREESCATPCERACESAVSRHLVEVKEETGYVLDKSDVKKVTESCTSQCFNECLKPGKSISFVFPFRPH